MANMEKGEGHADAQIERRKEKRRRGEKEFGDICNPKGVKTWTETQREDETIVDSESSSEKPDTQMSGETMKEPEICVTTEEAKEPEICVTTEEMKEGEKMPKKKRRVIADAEHKMGFGPYGQYTYEEVSPNEPEYAKFLIEEGRSNNMKGRFTPWAMAIMVDSFFEIGRDEPEGPDDSGSERRGKGGIHERRE